jgi:XTP/dITP diphosphohydrolase
MALKLTPGTRLVAATHNPGKAKEFEALLEGRFDLVDAASLGLAEPKETELTFVGNAVLKARAAAEASGLIAIADDSGLSVAAMNGAPGIYSARWAGPDKDFNVAMRRVEEVWKKTGSTDKSCWFTSALAVAWPDGPVVAVEGRIEGTLTFPGRGTQGFGYDPIFTPTFGGLTFGEMEPLAKDAVSHRARAFEKLREALF